MKFMKDGLLVVAKDVEMREGVEHLIERGFHAKTPFCNAEGVQVWDEVWSPTYDRMLIERIGKDEVLINPSVLWAWGMTPDSLLAESEQTGTSGSERPLIDLQ